MLASQTVDVNMADIATAENLTLSSSETLAEIPVPATDTPETESAPIQTDETPTTPSSTPKATLTAQPTSSTAKKSVLSSTGGKERGTVASAGGLIVLGVGLLGVIRHLRPKKQ
ncbi:hypothetical protein OfM2_05330 [Lactovum odontotermitis]